LNMPPKGKKTKAQIEEEKRLEAEEKARQEALEAKQLAIE